MTLKQQHQTLIAQVAMRNWPPRNFCLQHKQKTSSSRLPVCKVRLDTGWAAFSFGPKGFWELHVRIAEPTERCLAAWIGKRPEVQVARG